MAKKAMAPWINRAAAYPYVINPFETVAETGKRLAKHSAIGWPGSVSIHGNLLIGKKSEPKEEEVPLEAV